MAPSLTEYRAPSDITKSYGCNTALKSCSGHAGTMREPCGYHAGRHPHDTYSNDAQINVPAKKSLVVVNVVSPTEKDGLPARLQCVLIVSSYNAYDATYTRKL